MALQKDSAILEIYTANNGYFVRLWQWAVSPPPIPATRYGSNTTELRIDTVAADKTALITAFTSWVNNNFDQ